MLTDGFKFAFVSIVLIAFEYLYHITLLLTCFFHIILVKNDRFTFLLRLKAFSKSGVFLAVHLSRLLFVFVLSALLFLLHPLLSRCFAFIIGEVVFVHVF